MPDENFKALLGYLSHKGGYQPLRDLSSDYLDLKEGLDLQREIQLLRNRHNELRTHILRIKQRKLDLLTPQLANLKILYESIFDDNFSDEQPEDINIDQLIQMAKIQVGEVEKKVEKLQRDKESELLQLEESHNDKMARLENELKPYSKLEDIRLKMEFAEQMLREIKIERRDILRSYRRLKAFDGKLTFISTITLLKQNNRAVPPQFYMEGIAKLYDFLVNPDNADLIQDEELGDKPRNSREADLFLGKVKNIYTTYKLGVSSNLKPLSILKDQETFQKSLVEKFREEYDAKCRELNPLIQHDVSGIATEAKVMEKEVDVLMQGVLARNQEYDQQFGKLDSRMNDGLTSELDHISIVSDDARESTAELLETQIDMLDDSLHEDLIDLPSQSQLVMDEVEFDYDAQRESIETKISDEEDDYIWQKHEKNLVFDPAIREVKENAGLDALKNAIEELERFQDTLLEGVALSDLKRQEKDAFESYDNNLVAIQSFEENKRDRLNGLTTRLEVRGMQLGDETLEPLENKLKNRLHAEWRIQRPLGRALTSQEINGSDFIKQIATEDERLRARLIAKYHEFKQRPQPTTKLGIEALIKEVIYLVEPVQAERDRILNGFEIDDGNLFGVQFNIQEFVLEKFPAPNQDVDNEATFTGAIVYSLLTAGLEQHELEDDAEDEEIPDFEDNKAKACRYYFANGVTFDCPNTGELKLWKSIANQWRVLQANRPSDMYDPDDNALVTDMLTVYHQSAPEAQKEILHAIVEVKPALAEKLLLQHIALKGKDDPSTRTMTEVVRTNWDDWRGGLDAVDLSALFQANGLQNDDVIEVKYGLQPNATKVTLDEEDDVDIEDEREDPLPSPTYDAESAYLNLMTALDKYIPAGMTSTDLAKRKSNIINYFTILQEMTEYPDKDTLKDFVKQAFELVNPSLVAGQDPITLRGIVLEDEDGDPIDKRAANIRKIEKYLSESRDYGSGDYFSQSQRIPLNPMGRLIYELIGAAMGVELIPEDDWEDDEVPEYRKASTSRLVLSDLHHKNPTDVIQYSSSDCSDEVTVDKLDEEREKLVTRCDPDNAGNLIAFTYDGDEETSDQLTAISVTMEAIEDFDRDEVIERKEKANEEKGSEAADYFADTRRAFDKLNHPVDIIGKKGVISACETYFVKGGVFRVKDSRALPEENKQRGIWQSISDTRVNIRRSDTSFTLDKLKSNDYLISEMREIYSRFQKGGEEQKAILSALVKHNPVFLEKMLQKQIHLDLENDTTHAIDMINLIDKVCDDGGLSRPPCIALGTYKLSGFRFHFLTSESFDPHRVFNSLANPISKVLETEDTSEKRDTLVDMESDEQLVSTRSLA